MPPVYGRYHSNPHKLQYVDYVQFHHKLTSSRKDKKELAHKFNQDIYFFLKIMILM
jgi:hypothetical protein